MISYGLLEGRDAAVNYGEYIYEFNLEGWNGVSSCTYFIEATANNVIYVEAIISAINSWMKATKMNKPQAIIKFIRVYNKSDATITFTVLQSFPEPISTTALAYTMFYKKINDILTLATEMGDRPVCNWTNCIVTMKTDLSLLSATRTACHEIGHCLGLDHPIPGYILTMGDHKSVMYPYNSEIPKDFIAYYPTENDRLQIERKYSIK